MISVDRYLEANGIRQHFIEHVGSGPTALILPGLTANARFFDGLVHAGLCPELRVLDRVSACVVIDAPAAVDEAIVEQIQPSLGPPGYPPILDKEAADRTVAAMPNASLVELPGNHITALFGESARTAAESIVEFVTEAATTGPQ